jgi:hypothetical protein
MTKGKLLYRETVEIAGLPTNLFEKECRFELKSGLFYITHPTKVVDKNLIELDYVCAKSLEETEMLYERAVQKFKSLSYKYKSVILYQIEESNDIHDASGTGFVFNWGVFRKIKTDEGKNYVFERNYQGARDIWIGNSDIKDWKETKWSQQAEAFFIELSKQIEEIYNKLQYFVNHVDISEINNVKLLDSFNSK